MYILITLVETNIHMSLTLVERVQFVTEDAYIYS